MSGSSDAALRRRAMDLLARREHSRHELARKLHERFPEAEAGQIDAVIERLAAENLQSDQRFAENYLLRRKRDGFGWLHIRASLRGRGVDEDIVSALALPAEAWIEAADQTLARKRGRFDSAGGIVPGGTEHQRLFRFLGNRGFPNEIVHQVLGRHLAAAH